MTGPNRYAETSPPIRIGIVGGGRATTMLHLPALSSVPGANIVGIAESDQEARQRLAGRLPQIPCVGDYRVLLDDRTIDAIAVCTPAQSHVAIALAALEAGKHVLVEKPLALSLEECDRLLEGAQGTTRRVMVGFNTRWHRLARQARALIQEQAIGFPDVVESVLTSYHREVPPWRERRATGGGALLEMAIHHFDLWQFLLDSEVEEISAHTKSGTWDDEVATVTARLRCGALASGSFAERTSQQNRLEVFGRSGSLRVSFYQFDGLELQTVTEIPGNIPSRIGAIGRTLREFPRGLSTLRRGGEWQQSYVEQWRHFVESIQRGARVECGLEEGRRALAIALAAIESAATGRAIKLIAAEVPVSQV